MDESVVFVKELRSGDSDLCVIDFEDQFLNSGKRPDRKVKLNNPNKSTIDLTERMPKIKSQKKITSVGVQKNDESKKNKSCQNSEVVMATKSNSLCTLECPVCFGYLPDFIVKITSCGHMFCDSCITYLTNEKSPLCPICRKHIVKKNLRRVFLH